MLDLAVELAWTHVFNARPRVLGYCEREAFAASILLARMEDKTLEAAPVFCGDLCNLDARPLRGRTAIFAAGLPCQPYSLAGKKKGNTDARSWGDNNRGPVFHAIRIISECCPALVCLENVGAWVKDQHFESFARELCRMGYTIEDPLFVAAQDVGAAHRRERVFIVAYLPGERGQLWRLPDERRQADDDAQRSGPPMAEPEHRAGSTERRDESRGRRASSEADIAVFGGNRREVDDTRHAKRRKQDVQLAEPAGEGLQERECKRGDKEQECTPAERDRGELADAGCECGERRGERSELGSTQGPDACEGDERQWAGEAADSRGLPLFAPGPGDLDSWARALAVAPWLAPAIEPGVRVLASRLALVVDEHRPCQLRAIGNGVVVLQAACAFGTAFRAIAKRFASNESTT